MGGGDELNSIVDILKCDIKCFRVGDIMTAEKKSGLLPRLVGGAKQRAEGMVRVPYFPDFQDNPSSPATELQLEVQSKFIQIYSAKMEIHAQLSGLRHIMYHHPWISTLTGIMANISTLTVILLISWVKFTTTGPQKPEPARPERKVSESYEEEVTILEKPDAKDAVDPIETVSSWK